eukprot:gene17620-12611_t
MEPGTPEQKVQGAPGDDDQSSSFLGPISGEVRDPLFEGRVSQAKSAMGWRQLSLWPSLESFSVGTHGFPGIGSQTQLRSGGISRKERLVLLTR